MYVESPSPKEKRQHFFIFSCSLAFIFCLLNSGLVSAQSEEAGNRYGSVLVPYAVIEHPPAFPGCEGLEPGEAVKKCTSEKISGFVNKNFDTGIAKQLGLSGVNRVIVQFKIDENGEITDIRVRAPHPKLEEEARRVTDALPNMLPGKQRGKTVGTMYSLPIVFKVN